MGRPAKPEVPNSRPYTGYNGRSSGILPGLAQWIIDARRTSGGQFVNLGAWGIRDIKGKPGQPSVHSTGRAVDLGYKPRKGQPGGRKRMLPWLDRVIEHANLLGVEAVIDYRYDDNRSLGRGWFCDRQAWQTYDRVTVQGGGAAWALWIHVEISPAMGRDPRAVRAAFLEAFPEIPRDA